MEQQFFDRMLDEIYGAFGRQRPLYNTPAYKTLWRRVSEERGVPNEAARHIAYALSEYDSLPTNLGKAILCEFSEWLSRNPDMKAKAHSCKECSADIPGWFWAWQGNHRIVCKCACNQDDAFRHMQAWTRRMASRAGHTLDDPVAAQGRARRKHNEYTRSVGKQEPMREAHRRELEWQDAGNW